MPCGVQEKIYTANPDYVTPSVEDVEIMYVAFDIIYLNDCAINDLPLTVGGRTALTIPDIVIMGVIHDESPS